VFVAFGAEEPRGPGDDRHHYGSRHLVADLSTQDAEAILGMLSLDRVGVAADRLPLCYGGRGSDAVREQLVAAARRADVASRRCENRASDHWSFEKAGIPAARIGSVPYAEYHSARDVPDVVSRAQLARTGLVAWEWLQSPAE
jgi:Zn-dependent M28 family amino/carboxypeptidase